MEDLVSKVKSEMEEPEKEKKEEKLSKSKKFWENKKFWMMGIIILFSALFLIKAFADFFEIDFWEVFTTKFFLAIIFGTIAITYVSLYRGVPLLKVLHILMVMVLTVSVLANCALAIWPNASIKTLRFLTSTGAGQTYKEPHNFYLKLKKDEWVNTSIKPYHKIEVETVVEGIDSSVTFQQAVDMNQPITMVRNRNSAIPANKGKEVLQGTFKRILFSKNPLYIKASQDCEVEIWEIFN